MSRFIKGESMMAGKKKQQDTEATREPGFFSDEGYGNGTAITILHDPAKPKKGSKAKSSTKGKRK